MEDTATAFGSLNQRSSALAGNDPLDRICVRDYLREVEIGAFQSERGVTQRIRFNVVLEVGRHNAAQNDDVDKVISYDTIIEAIDLQLATERINLLETLAERVAERCLEDQRAMRVYVRIEKLDRIPGTLGIEIARSSKETAMPMHAVETPAQAETQPHPLVIYFSNEVINGPNLAEWLDVIAGHEIPAIICVGPGDMPQPKARVSMAQRRIDLLAIEQNAWVLAGMDKRCVVVDSRTELDWAIKHEQLSVWAPSKIVLDAVVPPNAASCEDLALWLAQEFQASHLILIGGELTTDSNTLDVQQIPANAPVGF